MIDYDDEETKRDAWLDHEEREEQRAKDERDDDETWRRERVKLASPHHAHVGTLHFANGWPMQLCSSCFETIDHRACLECASATSEGRQIHESERRQAWGDR